MNSPPGEASATGVLVLLAQNTAWPSATVECVARVAEDVAGSIDAGGQAGGNSLLNWRR